MNTNENDVISIMCPTRGRPSNVKRLVESILTTAEKPEFLEILFYVDNDDETFPKEVEDLVQVTVFRGPNIWISNAHNFLYVHSQGNIIFSAGDDMIFQTNGWDNIVRAKFKLIPDGIGLVFGDDLGTHAGQIATHGFFHRNWVDALGTWVQPGRGSLWDMWSTENARLLNRFFFMENLIIEHRHYRQSSSAVSFDDTYARIRTSNASFRPEITYRKLSRERRHDRLLLTSIMHDSPPIESGYLLSELIVRLTKNRFSKETQIRLRSLRNIQLIFALTIAVSKKFLRIKL